MQSKNSAVDQIAPPERRSFIEEARRAQIIDRAIDTIAELGFAQTSLAQIAKRAGISAGVISYYFAGKDDLIRQVAAAVFAAARAFMAPRVRDRPDAAASLRAFIEASIAFIAAQPNHTRALMNIIRGGHTPGGLPRYEPALEAPRREGFRQILEWGQRTGQFRAFSVPVMIATIIEALDAVPPQLAANPDLDLDGYARELVSLFDHATRADLPPTSAE